MNLYVPIRINSFFRGTALNKAIGGANGSQHTKGEAIDLDAIKGITNADIFNYIRDNLDYDQLIWEFGTDKEPNWVHVSYKMDSSKNRKRMLRAKKENGRTRYVIITNPEKEEEATDLDQVGVVTAKALNIRQKPSGKADKITPSLPKDTKVEIQEEKDGWLKVEATIKVEGWVSEKYVGK